MNGHTTGHVDSDENITNGKHFDGDKQLEVKLREILSIAEKRGEQIDFPFYLGDMTKVRHEYELWRTHFPRVQAFYAVKCCGETPLLKELFRLNCSFDCASQREIETMLNLGVDSSRIIFANTIKSVSSIKYAAQHGVSLMTFDNEFELEKIKTHYAEAQLVVRFRCKKSKYATYEFGMKFGCSLNKIEKLLQKAKSENFNVVGVSFHVGSNTDNEEPYVQAIRDADSVFSIGKKIGFKFQLLDIGGGFRGYHAPHLSFEKTAEKVSAALDEYFPPERGVRIIAEPGTRLATSAFTWAVKVIGKASNEELEEGYIRKENKMVKVAPRYMYYVNDGVYGTMSLNLEDVPKIKVLSQKGQNRSVNHPSVVFGPTCEPCDVVYPEINLPELDVGDWLYLENAGAYSLAIQGHFNMMPKAKCFYVDEDF